MTHHYHEAGAFRRLIGPLLLIFFCPPIAIFVWYINVKLGGSLLVLKEMFSIEGIRMFKTIFWPIIVGSRMAWMTITIFAAVQLLLMRIVPGKPFYGPITPMGNIPIYKANGPACFFLTLVLFYLCAYQWHLFSPTIIYDHFGEILGALNMSSFLFCFFLYFKGRFFPTTSDHSHSKNIIFDFFWGTELYPRFLGWDIKQFTNCRFGMMSWGLVILSFAAAQKKMYGLSDSMCVSVFLQLIYIAKFFLWETGYLRSLDIMHDRAGFYICWGVLVWIPAVYASPALYLVNHPNHLGLFWSLLITACGTSAILVNFFADRQRQKVRATQGKCLIWGKEARVIIAYYGEEQRENLLLTSGWWGLARHFHYIPELIGAFCWTIPALFHHLLPYFYVIYLALLLNDRAHRDDKRCFLKYGEHWELYCQEVPYKIIPYIY